jgi:hypothetical protein
MFASPIERIISSIVNAFSQFFWRKSTKLKICIDKPLQILYNDYASLHFAIVASFCLRRAMKAVRASRGVLAPTKVA